MRKICIWTGCVVLVIAAGTLTAIIARACGATDFMCGAFSMLVVRAMWDLILENVN